MSSVLAATSSQFIASFMVGEWLAEPALDRITCAGQALKLDPRSMAVLVYLAQQHNRVVSLRELDTHVWGEAVVAQSSIYQAIALLRRALGDTSQTRQYIETIPRKGYRLIAPVSWQLEASRANDPPQPEGDRRIGERRSELPECTAAEVPARRTSRFARWRLHLALMIGVCALGACAMAVRPLLASSAPPSLVVLPFADLTTGKKEQALGDGLAEEISNRLANTPRLRVVARTSAFKFRDATDVRSIGKELAATHVLEGSVRRGTHGNLIITAQLVSAATGFRDWIREFSPATTDILHIQDQVAREVAAALGVTVSDSMSKRLHAGAIDPRAYGHYLDGKFQFARRTPESYELASNYYYQALELEPDLAEAYVGLADIQANRLRDKAITLAQATNEIERLVDKALRLNDELPEAYLTRGTLRNEQARFNEAESDLSRAIELNHNMADAYQRLGQTFEQQGRSREALQRLSQAVDLDPYDTHKRALQCLAYMSVGRYPDAAGACERARTLSPGAVWPLYISALVEEEHGRPDLALEYYLQMDAAEPRGVDGLVMQAKLYGDLQMREAAGRAYASAQLRSPQATALRMAPAEFMVRAGELNELRDSPNRRELVLGNLEPTPDNLLLAAFHCLVVEDTRCAEEMLLGAQRHSGYGLDVLDPWRVRRTGGANALFVALLANVRGDTATRDRALALLETQLEQLERHGATWHTLYYLRARVAALQGRRDAALQALRDAVDRGWSKGWFARLDPCLSSLAHDVDFVALIHEVDHENQRRAALVRSVPSRS